MNVTITVDVTNKQDVTEAINALSRAADITTLAPEAPAAPVAEPTAAPVAEPTAAPVAEPTAAPSAAPVTLAQIKDMVSKINSVDNTKLTDVKAALNELGVAKVGEIPEASYENFYNKIKGLV